MILSLHVSQFFHFRVELVICLFYLTVECLSSSNVSLFPIGCSHFNNGTFEDENICHWSAVEVRIFHAIVFVNILIPELHYLVNMNI